MFFNLLLLTLFNCGVKLALATADAVGAEFVFEFSERICCISCKRCNKFISFEEVVVDKVDVAKSNKCAAVCCLFVANNDDCCSSICCCNCCNNSNCCWFIVVFELRLVLNEFGKKWFVAFSIVAISSLVVANGFILLLLLLFNIPGVVGMTTPTAADGFSWFRLDAVLLE